MKRIALTAFIVVALNSKGFTQTLKILAGTAELEIKEDKQKSRKVEDDGSTTCGFYAASTSTFFPCKSGKGEHVDSGGIEEAPDCCEKINLTFGSLIVYGTVKLEGAKAVVSTPGFFLTIDLTANSANIKNVLQSYNNETNSFTVDITSHH